MHLAKSKGDGHLDISVVRLRMSLTELASATRAAVTTAVLLASLLGALQAARAQTETVLYDFNPQIGDGSGPVGVVMDNNGNLYGATFSGGSHRDGTVYKLNASGTETVLYNFGSQAGDGYGPTGGLIRDGAGNLYGITEYGGTYDFGTVFKVTPSGAEKVLHTFGSNSQDGVTPVARLIRDAYGNLYGTTITGGSYNHGTVFRLSARGIETVLYSFGGRAGDGQNPFGDLMRDSKGNLYSTTYSGGTYGHGTVFKLTPGGTETVLYSFGAQSGDGIGPSAGVTMDNLGNLYGTTLIGGAYNYGTLFKLSSSRTETVLHSFGAHYYYEGTYPEDDLVKDSHGNLYSTTTHAVNFSGTVYRVAPDGSVTVLYAFGTNGPGDGQTPFGRMAMDNLGNLYGTTLYGGSAGYGTVFKITP